MLDTDATALFPDRISGCAFFDIYLSNDERQTPMVRGLRPLNSTTYQGRPGVGALPDCLAGDVGHLLGKVEARFAETGEAEFVVLHDGIYYRCALIAAPGTVGIAGPDTCRDWCVRQIGSSAPILGDIELPGDLVSSLRDAGKERGLVIISGSFGSGKSTTASAALLDWVTGNRESAVTFEDPPEFPLAGRYPDGGIIHQVPVTQETLSGSIISARRWSPRYVFLGEIRTPGSAAELLHMAISGPMTLCTVHASDLVQALASLARFAGTAIGDTEARRMIAASLRLVVHQDLSWGHMIARKAVFHAHGMQAMRHKIETGRFNALYEDFERQSSGLR